jgi:Domain of unknown function (DUF4145)
LQLLSDCASKYAQGGYLTNDLKALDDYVSRSDWPRAGCPVCGDGYLIPETFETLESPESMRLHDDESWEPDWIRGTFHGSLKCVIPSCGEWAELFRLRIALPAFPILTPPSETAEQVKEAIHGASEVLWVDPSAAANRLRFAIETALTAIGMRRYTRKNGKLIRISTHQRITEFKKRDLEAGEALEAVKWIGNSGSHGDSLTASDVLDGAEFLEYRFRLIYNKNDQGLRRRIGP